MDWLNTVTIDGKELYSRNDIQKLYETIPLVRGGYLVLNKDEGWLNFAVLQFERGTSDGAEYLKLLFHGAGPTETLRECRHTYWGKDGYVFYIDGILVIDAFKHLSKYFDMMYPKVVS